MNCRKNWIIFFIVFALSIIAFQRRVLESSPLRNGSPFKGPIFVLLYHPWEEGFETAFRNHLDWLKQNGYQTIPLEALIDYLEGREAFLPPKPILLTFDDGTIENYNIVYPILQEFGFIGIAFVITGSFFTPDSQKFWWKEVDRSGILEVESHTRTHSLIWISPHIIDFYSGEDSEYYYLIKGKDWRLGAPIYEFGYELVNDRYLPDRRITNLCVEYIVQNGGEAFFKREDWRDELLKVVDNFRGRYREKGSYETEVQKDRRHRIELLQSKRTIERTIGRGETVEFFAYPWGVYDEELILQLKRYGYRGAFTTDWGGNFPGDDPFKIKRFVITSEMTVEDLSNILESE